MLFYFFSDNGERYQHDPVKDSEVVKNILPQVPNHGGVIQQGNNCADDPKVSHSELNSTSASNDLGNNDDSCNQDKYAKLPESSQGKKRKSDDQSRDPSHNTLFVSPSNRIHHISSHCDASTESEKRFKSGHENSVTKSVHQNDPSLGQHLKQLSYHNGTQNGRQINTNLDRHLNSVIKNVSTSTAQNLGREFLLPKNLLSSESKQHKSKKRYE